MKGRVLGFDAGAGTGAISGEDGNRYVFASSDWRGEDPPKAGQAVDFVANADAANEVYAATAGGPDLSAITGNPALMGFVMKPHVVGALVAMLGWLVAGHLLLVNYVFDGINSMGQLSDLAGGGSFFFLVQLAMLVLLLLYLIPMALGWLLWKTWASAETDTLKQRAGLASVALPIVVPILAAFLIWLGLPGEVKRLVRDGFSVLDMIDIDLGLILMLAGGVLILLQRAGVVKSFDGR